jgi:hypothetical protein
MPNDWWRATQQWISNIMNSEIAHLVTKTGFLALVKQRRSDLYPHVEANFDTVWNWVRDNFF